MSIAVRLWNTPPLPPQSQTAVAGNAEDVAGNAEDVAGSYYTLISH